MGIPGGEIWVQFQENFLMARNGLSSEVVNPHHCCRLSKNCYLLIRDFGLGIVRLGILHVIISKIPSSSVI